MITGRSSACPLLTRVRASVDRDAAAVAIAGGGAELTYGDLWSGIRTWRDAVSVRGLPTGTAIAIPSHGSPDLVAAFLGVRAAGLVPLPLDLLLPRTRREEMIRIARPAAVLDLGAGTVAPMSQPPRQLPPEAGYLGFSSGTQGTPKGIIGNAEGVSHFVDWQAELLGLGPGTRVAMLAPPSFDVMLREMLLPLTVGGVLCVPDPHVRTDPGAVVGWLDAQAVQVVHLVPTLSLRWAAAAGTVRTDRLSWAVFAGEPLYGRHVAAWRQIAPQAGVVNLYGPSETTLAKFFHVVTGDHQGLLPVGTGIPGTRLLRRAPTTGSCDGTFQIVIETPDGSLGYLPDGGAPPDAGLVREGGVTTFVTQDRGRIDGDGRLYVEGRLDGLVKRNGVMIDLAAVTAAALDHPDVQQAYCVQVRADTTADVVLAVEATAALSLRGLTRHLLSRLGPAMPNEVLPVERLPQLPNGKVDRRALVARIEGAVGGHEALVPDGTGRPTGEA